MSDDNFEKLDNFMNRNVPQMSKVSGLKKKLNGDKSFGPLEYVFALGLSCLIGYTIIDHENKKIENAFALTDALEWDVTSDEDVLSGVAIDDLEI